VLTASRELVPGQSVTVEVPATCANLGPGFDCFGLALDWRERIRLEVIDDGYQIDVSGEGSDQIPRDESHLIVRSALIGLADLRVSVPGLRLSCHNTIPHGRGLGSSSAAIVAGLTAAQCLAGRAADREWVLRHADAIEGHPDNVAAAVYGGFVLAYDGPNGVRVASAAVADGLGIVLLVPQTTVVTHASRSLLPDEVPHSDAAANAGRAALLVHALAADHSRLVDATRDWLHQDYRQRSMPASYELMVSLRGHGFAAVISGAGPTVLVLGPASELDALSARTWPGFRTLTAQVGTAAAVVADLSAGSGETRR